jgi:3',5'-cyclic AMP phosphodiesterase CpdA
VIGRQPGGLRVFAVEDTGVQVTWSRLPAGRLALRTGDAAAEVDHPGGPGGLTIDGLSPGRRSDVVVSGSPLAGRQVRLSARTLDGSLGRELARVATISDLHIGIDFFGVFGTMREEGRFHHDDPHPWRCASAAIAELLDWGATRLFVKGDVTNAGQPEEWELVGKLFADLPVPMLMLPGNHDVRYAVDAIDPRDGARIAGVQMVEDAAAVDVGGARVVLVDSTTDLRHEGDISRERQDQACALLSDSKTGCLLLTHHFFHDTRIRWHWPPGVPFESGDRFLRAVAAANPHTLVSSGHSHRHRRRQVDGVEVTEVGSPKDYPGTWAGYVIYERGIRQVVRRVAAPEAIGWTEYTGRGAGGVWRHWSPGRLDDRCFEMPWT